MEGEGLIRRSSARRLGEGEAHAGFYAILDFLKLCSAPTGKATAMNCLGCFSLSLTSEMKSS